MKKTGPQTRRAIHEKGSIDEISENVKNAVKNTVQTRSKTRTTVVNYGIVDDDIYHHGTSDEEEDDDESIELLDNRDSNGSYEISNKPKRRLKKTSKSDYTSDEYTISSDLDSPKVKNTKVPYHPEKSMYQTADFKEKKTTKSKNANSCLRVYLILGFILFSGLGYLYFYDDGTDSQSIEHSSEKDRIQSVLEDVKVTLRSMMSKYKNQGKDLWTDVYVSINNIVKDPKKPSIIVLLGDKTDPIDCLAVLLGNISGNALNSGILQLTPEKFENDMGSVITSLRSSIKDNKAVIVWDLLNINVEALKAFHNLCDRINPLVEEVIYIITIISDDYDKTSSPLKFVEEELKKKLSGKIKEDAIQPLITRITDGPILSINPEPTLEDCPLPKVSRRT